MSVGTASRLAWSLWAGALALVAGGLLLGVAARPQAPLHQYWLESTLINPTFATLGALIASRRPGNVIGWIFCVTGVAGGIQIFSGQYANVALFSDDTRLPGGAIAGSLSTLMQSSVVAAALFLILLFPTGRLPSPRWRPVMWGAVVFVAFFTLVTWLSPDSVDLRLAPIGNPLGLDLGVMRSLGEIVYFGLPLLLVACGASVVVRFRRSGGDERQQIKWFAYAVAMMILLFASWFLLALTGFVPPDVLLWTIPLLGLPAGVGVAILRHRLYDIDVVINTTLVYGSLTAALAGVYVASMDAALPYGAGVGPRRGRLHPCDSGAVQPVETTHTGVRGPPLLQEQVRRGADPRSLLDQVARRDGPRQTR